MPFGTVNFCFWTLVHSFILITPRSFCPSTKQKCHFSDFYVDLYWRGVYRERGRDCGPRRQRQVELGSMPNFRAIHTTFGSSFVKNMLFGAKILKHRRSAGIFNPHYPSKYSCGPPYHCESDPWLSTSSTSTKNSPNHKKLALSYRVCGVWRRFKSTQLIQ